MVVEQPQEGEALLSTMPAGSEHRRHALIVVAVATIIVLLAAPFARVPLPPAWAFISIQESAMLVINLITAVLLLEQFSVLRSRALLVLAAGYLYAALMAIPHLLPSPGTFARARLLGDGPQIDARPHVLGRVRSELSLVSLAFLTPR